MDLLVRNSRIKLSQGQVFWREIGSGPAVVFLHGSFCDSSQWLPLMEQLSSDYHCFAPDLLGFGESERPNIHYSIDLEVECLAEYLEALHQRQVYLIGHSLGGWIAASYALKYLDRVEGIVLLAPVGVLGGMENTIHRRWMRLLLLSVSLVLRLWRSLQSLVKTLRRQKKVKQSPQQRLEEQFPTACKLLFERRQSEIAAELLQERLNMLKVPVLILQGEQDTPAAVAQSEAYADLAPTATLHRIKQAGNDLPQALPDVVAEHVRDFLSRHSSFDQ